MADGLYPPGIILERFQVTELNIMGDRLTAALGQNSIS